MTEGWLFDGVVATRRRVTFRADAAVLVLTVDDDREEVLAPGALHQYDEQPGTIVLAHRDRPGWRLGLPEPVPDDIAALLPKPQRYGAWIDRIGLKPALAIGLVVTLATVALIQFSPAWIAPLVPRALEQRYGDALVGDLGGGRCNAPAGRAAIDTLVRRLGVTPEDGVRVRVVDIGLVNAAALPGGNVVLFRGLIDDARGPDEVAGVLAHEIGHVRERHVTEALVRHAGFGLLISSLGGNLVGNADALLASRYSRGAEREADAAAIAMLGSARISPRATAAFFTRMARMDGTGQLGGTLAYLSTHPDPRDRARAFTAAARGATSSSLSDSEWRGLRAICGGRGRGRRR